MADPGVHRCKLSRPGKCFKNRVKIGENWDRNVC